MTIQTALVVDDSRSARYILQRLLEQRRIRVAVAASAQQAFAYLQAHRPDVVFMDDMMPGMDGLEAVERLGADPRTADIPVILYTGNEHATAATIAGADPAPASAPVRRGIVGVLSKPFTQSDVSALLAKLDGPPQGRPYPPQLRRVPEVADTQPVMTPPRVQSLDSLRAQLADGLKIEARMMIEQILGEELESRVAAQIERHTSVWRQALEHVRLEQLRANSHLVDERLPRWQELLEQRLETRLGQLAADVRKQFDDLHNAEQLTALQRAQVAHIVRTEATGLIERPARQSARHVAAELMRGDLSAVNLRLERLRRRFDILIFAATIAAVAAAVIGYCVGALV